MDDDNELSKPSSEANETLAPTEGGPPKIPDAPILGPDQEIPRRPRKPIRERIKGAVGTARDAASYVAEKHYGPKMGELIRGFGRGDAQTTQQADQRRVLVAHRHGFLGARGIVLAVTAVPDEFQDPVLASAIVRVLHQQAVASVGVVRNLAGKMDDWRTTIQACHGRLDELHGVLNELLILCKAESVPGGKTKALLVKATAAVDHLLERFNAVLAGFRIAFGDDLKEQP